MGDRPYRPPRRILLFGRRAEDITDEEAIRLVVDQMEELAKVQAA